MKSALERNKMRTNAYLLHNLIQESSVVEGDPPAWDETWIGVGVAGRDILNISICKSNEQQYFYHSFDKPSYL